MASTRLEINVRSVPEVLAEMRRLFAEMVREVALDESPEVCARLRVLADLFECGLSHEGDI